MSMFQKMGLGEDNSPGRLLRIDPSYAQGSVGREVELGKSLCVRSTLLLMVLSGCSDVASCSLLMQVF